MSKHGLAALKLRTQIHLQIRIYFHSYIASTQDKRLQETLGKNGRYIA